MKKTDLTAERLRELLHYNRKTGVFTRLVALCGRVKVGDIAGGDNGGGHIKIRVEGRLYFAHCLAWLYVKGEWPDHEVDHKDTIRSNNAWRNLRASSDALNAQNRRHAHRNNKSGLLGVTKTRYAFMASIQTKGKKYYLGSYRTPEKAHAVYVKAKRAMHAGCTL